MYDFLFPPFDVATERKLNKIYAAETFLLSDKSQSVHLLDTQTQIRDDAGQVLLDEDVPGLEVSVGDGRLALGAGDLQVEVGQPRGDGEGHVYHPVRGHRGPEKTKITLGKPSIKKNGIFNDIDQNSVYPHPPWPISDKYNHDYLLEAETPTLLGEIMTSFKEFGDFWKCPTDII